MINILLPLNKSVPPLYKYYPEFFNNLANCLGEENMNVTILVFSDLLVNHLDSFTMIDGVKPQKNKNSMSELENEYNFSFKQIFNIDLMQTSDFINKTFWRNIYIPESEFSDNKVNENKLNQIVELFEKNNYTHVITDQTPDFEQSFIRYLCNKKNIPFIRYLPNFMTRAYFVSYDNIKDVRIIKAPISQIKEEALNGFLENYINGNSPTIFSSINNVFGSIWNFDDYLLPPEAVESLNEPKRSIFEKIKNKSLNDYYQFFIEHVKRFYIDKIESQLKKPYYSSFDKDKKYIYYGLALTVESHLALQSFPFLNQINVIETISRSLPHGYILYVKPHPWWSSTVSLTDLKKISKIPFVKILDPKHEIKKVLKYSRGIVTLNSTSGIEALALGKSVIALAETNSYADLHPDASYCANLYDLPSMIVKMVNKSVNKKDTIEYFKQMFSYSSENPFEADKYASLEDARKKAKDFSEYIKLVISNFNKK